ncbi:PHB depolymerase family esterase [Streptomyces sp. SID11385]|uniref:carboxylesterase family protein n=1 Tax=Streptomyces sp. SID11385 TaxID=2706031 RepID=UPI0013CB57E4|nr:PHB depolymerase family esterase [Streptomyces sp. SID11385]NEA42001.1 prolyl oligopeptidase family serine peptidase [Streptomyces sp. SID11385]
MRKLRKVVPAARRHEVVEGEAAPADVLSYLLHLPEEYDADPARTWPLVLFLHGAGERGVDLEAVTSHGIPKLAEGGREFPFVVASPQCPASSQWVPEVTMLARLLDEVEAEYRIDPSRIYVTGLSMGGYATWSLAVRYPERFAAVAPVCGGLWLQSPDPIRDVPVWAFHGEEDDVVPIRHSEEIVTALEALGADVRFTRYPGVGHDSWTATYDDPALYDWLLSHRRTDKAPAS